LWHGNPANLSCAFARPETRGGRSRGAGAIVRLNHLDLWLEQGALPIPVRSRARRAARCRAHRGYGCGGADWKRGDEVAVQSNLFAANASLRARR